MMLSWSVFICVVIPFAAMQTDFSEFRRYPSAAALRDAPAKLNLDTPKGRRMRTVLREAALQAPNFNGHYRVTHWGCGTNCIEWAVIDLATGKVWFAPEPALSCWPADASAKTSVANWFQKRVDSSLLYLHRCTHRGSDLVFNTRDVYVWADGTLKLVRTDSLAK